MLLPSAFDLEPRLLDEPLESSERTCVVRMVGRAGVDGHEELAWALLIVTELVKSIDQGVCFLWCDEVCSPLSELQSDSDSFSLVANALRLDCGLAALLVCSRECRVER